MGTNLNTHLKRKTFARPSFADDPARNASSNLGNQVCGETHAILQQLREAFESHLQQTEGHVDESPLRDTPA